MRPAAFYIAFQLLKGTGSSIWLRNVQLGLFGVMFGLFGVWSKDGEKVSAAGFFQVCWGFLVLLHGFVVRVAAGCLVRWYCY